MRWTVDASVGSECHVGVFCRYLDNSWRSKLGRNAKALFLKNTALFREPCHGTVTGLIVFMNLPS